MHYAKTLELWAAALAERRDEAEALCGANTYQTYLRYLTGYFRAGHIDVMHLCEVVQRNGIRATMAVVG